MSATAARIEYDDLPSVHPICRTTADSPNATTQASKLIHRRRKVSGWTWRMTNAPIGTPRATPGRIEGRSDSAGRVNKPVAA